MSYFMLPGLGAEESETTLADTMANCSENLKDYDYDTASGRRAANIEAGRCSAEAVCAYFSQGAVPPGVCGTIGAKVAEWVGDAFEAIFGADEYAEWLKGYKARQGAENEAALITAKLDAYQAVMDAAVEAATAAMVVAWDSSVPEQRGKLGGGAELTFVWDPKWLKSEGTPSRMTPSTVSSIGNLDLEWVSLFDPPIQVTSFQTTLPASLLLKEFGADIELRGNGRYRAPDIRLHVLPDSRSLVEARAYAKTVEDAFLPKWLKSFNAATGKAQAFVTSAAATEQSREIAAKHEKVLVSAQLVGEQRSKRLNVTLLGLGALALGGAWLATRRKR